MKKITALLLVLIFALALFAGCASNTAASSKAVKTGLAFVTLLDKSSSDGTADGVAQADSYIAAVTVGSDGKLVRCAVDLAQTKGSFNTSGQVVTPLDTKFQTKNEQGADKGMEALNKYLVGKTADQIKAVKVDGAGLPTDNALKSKVMFPITGYIDAVTKAIAGAQDLGAAAGDKLGVGVETNIAYSNNAGVENPANPGNKDGNVLIYATFAAATTDKDGRITSCLADGWQGAVSFDETGKIVSDLTAVPVTKNEKGNDFGLKAFSSIGKEWFEQTAALGLYAKGKTASEIAGIAVKDDTSPASEDMRATVTLKIGEFKKVLVKAAAQ
jgi:hypothetical protein